MATPSKNQMEPQTIDRALFQTFIHEGLPPLLAMIMVAWARYQSSNYNSRVYYENNNAFGFAYVPGNRYGATPGLTKGNGNYANYLVNTDSAKAAADWAKHPRRWPLLKNVKNLLNFSTVMKTLGLYQAPIFAYALALNRGYKSVQHLVKTGTADSITQAYDLQKSTSQQNTVSSLLAGLFS